MRGRLGTRVYEGSSIYRYYEGDPARPPALTIQNTDWDGELDTPRGRIMNSAFTLLEEVAREEGFTFEPDPFAFPLPPSVSKLVRGVKLHLVSTLVSFGGNDEKA